MKRLYEKALILLICCVCMFTFVSCKNAVNTDEAKAFIGDLFTAIAAEDYEKAESFLHPERPADIETFLLNAEQELNVNFGDGITVEKYTTQSLKLYDSTVKGASSELTIKTKVGEREVKFEIEIVKNDNGYGIYNFTISQ